MLFLCSPEGHIVAALSVRPISCHANNFKTTVIYMKWQWRKGQCTRTIILPCMFTELSPRNHLFFITNACPGHILSTKGLKWKLVYRYMAVRGRTVHKNHNLTMYITKPSSLNHCYYNGCLSWPYLWKLVLNGLKLKQQPFGEHSSLPAIFLLFILVLNFLIFCYHWMSKLKMFIQ